MTSSDSTHKTRSVWFQARESWPFREAPVGRLNAERARAELEVPAAAGIGQWSLMGPTNIGGRMTCAVCHPTIPERVWAGAAGGGVWYSSDAGKSWQPQWHKEESMNVGALAIDPQRPDVLYCGTGEANLSVDSHPGVGVLRSEDAGASWSVLADAASAGLPRRIGALAVDPFDSKRLLAGGVNHGTEDERGQASGMFKSTDGGSNWILVPFVGGSAYRCYDIRFHSGVKGLVFVAISTSGAKNGIWRSRDGGATWTQLQGGLPRPDRMGRTSLALAPSDPDVLYAQIARKAEVLGVYRSADGGDTWVSIGGTHFKAEGQMSYNNAIAVHPEHAGWVLCGGVNLHRTMDAGQRWEQVTRWDAVRGTSTYAHADHHALLMPPSRPGWVYDLNDGGLDFSSDGGSSWENRSKGLATNMFYDLDVAQSNGNIIGGGAQDNGTLATLDGQPDNYVRLTGGDGGGLTIDPRDAKHIFSTNQGMRIWRLRSAELRDVSPKEDQFTMFKVFLSMNSTDRKIVFSGSRRVWRTVNDGDSWEPASEVLDNSDITALEVARDDSRRIYVGTMKGGFFRSDDSGKTWSDNLASTVLPGRTITRVQSKADDADTVYVTIANFGNRHLFRSTDGGGTWVDTDRGLPDVPLHSMALPARHPRRIYVCGDAGVFVSDDEGRNWSNLTGNLPTVMVVDLVYHERDRTLTAATYGRSIWRLRVD